MSSSSSEAESPDIKPKNPVHVRPGPRPKGERAKEEPKPGPSDEKSDEETSNPAEDFSNHMAAMDRVRGAIDEEYEGETDDLENAVADDHLVHPVLLLLHDDHHCPSVEGDGEKKNGKSNPKEKGIRDLRITIKTK